jgi:hypothetical protein
VPNLKVTPHVAQNLGRPGGSAIDARTTQHVGYAISQRKRKRIEECFGWLKTIALLRKVRHRGVLKVGWVFTFAAAAYNLVECAIWQFKRRKPKAGVASAGSEREPLATNGCSQSSSPVIKSTCPERESELRYPFFRSLLEFTRLD